MSPTGRRHIIGEWEGDSVHDLLAANGIARLDEPIPASAIDAWNVALDPVFAEVGDSERSEVSAGQLLELGILGGVFTPVLRSAIRSTMEDAVIHHCHVYETPANQARPHILADNGLSGWHVDRPPQPGLRQDVVNYLYCFVYLSDVAADGGGFEFLPRPPARAIKRHEPSVRVDGPKGTAFLWNGAFYHRASPNVSSRRRRVLKLSFMHNFMQNPPVASADFAAIRAAFEGDEFLSFLFGGRQQQWPKLATLPAAAAASVGLRSFTPNDQVDFPRREHARRVARAARRAWSR